MRKRKNTGRKVITIIIAILLSTIIAVAVVKIVSRKEPTGEIDSVSQSTTEPESVQVDADTEPETSEKPTTTEQTTKPTTTKPTETQATTANEKTVTVYATTKVNVRTKPSTDSKIVTMLDVGDKVERISKGSDGWSKVIYKGETRYIYSEYLTEEKIETTKRNVVDPRGDNWNLVVVNFYNEYDSTYEPKLKKVCADYGYNSYMDERVADHYTEMYKAALKDGIKLVPVSGYRSYATQEKNYNNRIKLWQSRGYSYNESVKRTAEVILPPGTSEHNLGLAMDICSLENTFENTKEYKWLVKNAQDYGFILRYTEENRSKTGIVSEPWHWRYVGVDHAKAIKESGLCLEDYVKTLT